MAQENVEIVRTYFEEFLAGGNEFDATNGPSANPSETLVHLGEQALAIC